MTSVRWRNAPALLLIAGAPWLAAACSQAQPRQGEAPPVPVSTAAAVATDVPIEVRSIGTVEAYSTIDVRAQVGGVLEEVHFREGQDVRKGDLLFTLDSRPYQAALEAAQAALARDSALLKTAQQDVKRYTGLVKKEYVTQEEYDQIETNAATLEAAVRKDKADIDDATVNLEYCTIRSPIDGRTGRLQVHAGNLVKANSDNPLVTIKKIVPVYVSFSVPERYLTSIRQRKDESPLTVRAKIPDSDLDPIEGTLSFVDNSVDRSTGTVSLKATFPNRDRALWPGLFVDTSLVLGMLHGAVVVPSQAIQTGQHGPYVFVVKDDQTVDSREVTPGQVSGAVTVIDKGLQAGETVVTDGQLRLIPGAKIASRSAPDGEGSATPASGSDR
ncbi:MAG TPA: efflux RND transporter periplasmic adaptor subunit [Candidatus Saccharimonadales bacterium]|nr:efflux RND transporter periplasmic adaptor subunit [Candidatus Saccharimonadales bacterium]